MCEKIHQFLSSTKKMHTKENWFLFSASRCRSIDDDDDDDDDKMHFHAPFDILKLAETVAKQIPTHCSRVNKRKEAHEQQRQIQRLLVFS